MNIFFIGHSIDGGYLYRCLNNINISKYNASGDVDLKKETKIFSRKIVESDVVVFYRPSDEKRLHMMKLLKQKGVKVGYDNDDTFNFQDSHRLLRSEFKDISEQKKEWNTLCLREADFITTTTNFLADEYRKTNDNVYVSPNLIDFNLYPKPTKHKKGSKTRILLSGSLLWCNDSYNFIETIRELNMMGNVQVVMFGNYTKEIMMDGIEYHDYVNPLKYPYKLDELNIDLCLIPREDNYFNKAKSNCKYLEMSALKIPVIAQGFKDKNSPYDIVAAEGAPITIATDDWLEKISKVDLNKSGYRWVKKNYNNDSNIFDEIIKKEI